MAVRNSLIRLLRLSHQDLSALLIWVGLGILLLTVVVLSLVYGLSEFSDANGWLASMQQALTRSDNGPAALVFWELRLPRVLMGLMVGAGLAIAGCLMQAVFKNPLASPGLVGVSSGASFFAALAIVGESAMAGLLPFIATGLHIPFAAFLGSLLVCLIVFRISHIEGRTSMVLLLMSGVALNAIAESLTGFLVYLSNDEQLRSITFWSLGSLAGSNWFSVMCMLPMLIAAVLMIPFTYQALNAISAGDELAQHLGFDVELLKRLILVFVALTVGVAVAFTGRIGFIGLMVPHLCRMMVGANHRYVLLSSLLLGPVLLISADFLSRHLAAPAEVPIGILTSALGGPFFLYLLIKMRKHGSRL